LQPIPDEDVEASPEDSSVPHSVDDDWEDKDEEEGTSGEDDRAHATMSMPAWSMWDKMGPAKPFDAAEFPELPEVLGSAGMWSTGTPCHFHGECKPCHFVHGARGCGLGSECGFCHLPHPTNRKGSRLSMNTRVYCKLFAEVLSSTYGGRPEDFKCVAMACAKGNQFLLRVMETQFEKFEQQRQLRTAISRRMSF